FSVAAGATTAATGRAATAAKFAKFRRVKAGGGDDVVLVTIGASGRADVNTGTGATDRVLVRPGVGRSAAGRVDVHGRSSRMVIALPAHAGSLRVDVTGSRGHDRVTTRKLGGRGASPGGYRIAGGPGNDYLAGGDGRDTLIGGPGRDTCVAGRGDVV